MRRNKRCLIRFAAWVTVALMAARGAVAPPPNGDERHLRGWSPCRRTSTSCSSETASRDRGGLMRVQPRVLAVVALLAAMVTCVGASAGPTGPAQASHGIAAPGSAVRPDCDPDNGGLNLPGGFCALVVYDAKTATAVLPECGTLRLRPTAMCSSLTNPRAGASWRCGTPTGTGRPTRPRDSARAPATASTSGARISISHRTIA